MRARAFLVSSVLAAAVLGVAAALKVAFPTPLMTPWGTLPASPYGHVLASIEAVLAWSLVRGAWPRTVRFAAIGLFGMYAGMLTSFLLAGSTTCGCFGPASVPLVIVLLIDSVLVVGFVVGKPTEPTAMPQRGECLAVGFLMLALVLLSVSRAVNIPTPTPSPVPVPFGPTVQFHAGRAYGFDVESFRKGASIDRYLMFYKGLHGDSFREGSWLLIVSRPSCEHCRDAIRTATLLANARSKWNVGIVWRSPDELDSARKLGLFPSVEQFALASHDRDGRINWTVPVPLIVVIENGRIVAAGKKMGDIVMHL